MKAWKIAALAALAMCGAASASAQTGRDYAGTWSFQTEPYGNEQFALIMSGAAIVTPTRARDRFTIRLIANELIIARESGESDLVTAHQTCEGRVAGEVLNITCQLAEPIEGYQPDNFILQRGETPGQLVGALNSAANAQVTFTRMR